MFKNQSVMEGTFTITIPKETYLQMKQIIAKTANLDDEVEGLKHELETAQMQIEIQKRMLDELSDKYIGQKMMCDSYETENQ